MKKLLIFLFIITPFISTGQHMPGVSMGYGYYLDAKKNYKGDVLSLSLNIDFPRRLQKPFNNKLVTHLQLDAGYYFFSGQSVNKNGFGTKLTFGFFEREHGLGLNFKGETVLVKDLRYSGLHTGISWLNLVNFYAGYVHNNYKEYNSISNHLQFSIDLNFNIGLLFVSIDMV